MADLSISKAWDESRSLFASDGRLFTAIAVALMGVPSMISGLIAPEGLGVQSNQPWYVDLLLFAFMLVARVGQLALVRMALKPSLTVGAAIAHGARRMPVYLGTAMIITVAIIAVAVPVVVIAMLSGVTFDSAAATKMTPAMAVLVLVIVVIAVLIGVRMLMGTPVAAAESAGPVEIIKRSWRLTAGVWWKLLGFLVMILIGAGVVALAISMVVGSAVTIALGPIEPMSTSALVVGLFQGLFNAAFTAVFAVMLARIYVQLSGRDTVEAPSNGI